MQSRFADFIFSTKLGAYLLVAYMAVYFISVFFVGIDHAGARDMANRNMERLGKMTLQELGQVKVRIRRA